MFDINKLIRNNIMDLKPYSSARDEFNGSEGIFLDANENPYGRLNRYPDPHHTTLRQKIGETKAVDPSNVFIGNGSDEIIDLVFRIFCSPGKDRALTFNPTYGMYEVAAAVNDVELLKIDLDDSFQIDLNALIPLLSDSRLKLIIVCSPNNPTGNLIKNIDLIIKNFDGIVLVDEAYIDFSEDGSLMKLTGIYENLIVCQTFSKAFGLAGARVGVAYAQRSIIDIFYRVKPPYNVSSLNQQAALEVLDNYEMTLRRKEKILDERIKLGKELEHLSIVRKVWPSDANFLLVEFDRAEEVFSNLRSQNIIVRNRTGQVKDALRITTGTPAENSQLLNALRRIEDETYFSPVSDSVGNKKKGSSRSSRIVRSTSETSIVIDLVLDGEGLSDISTGIGFFDHMLCQVARHGGFDLDISVSGDLHVDEHHTIEDVALALGDAFDKALGNRKGIERFGFLLPMDDSLAQVAVDFGGRPYMVWDVNFERKAIGEMPSEMISHFFRSFAEKARCNLNIKAEGVNEHHKAEAIFKAFARATGMAVRKSDNVGIPSTKGVL